MCTLRRAQQPLGLKQTLGANRLELFLKVILKTIQHNDKEYRSRESGASRQIRNADSIISGSGDCPVVPLAWRKQEVGAKLFAWCDQKPQSPSDGNDWWLALGPNVPPPFASHTMAAALFD
jgi:hypothetical protein